MNYTTKEKINQGTFANIYKADFQNQEIILKKYHGHIIQNFDYSNMVKTAYKIRKRFNQIPNETLINPLFQIEEKDSITTGFSFIQGQTLEQFNSAIAHEKHSNQACSRNH